MFLTIVLLAVVGFVLYVKWAQSYWQRQDVPTVENAFFFGHSKNVITKKLSLGESVLRSYNELKKLGVKHAGRYFFVSPNYMPMDPVLIKRIMLKDFSHFSTRGLYHHPSDVLSMNLFNLDGEKWRDLRIKLTPTFTSGKMKLMFETLLDKTAGLKKLVEQYSISHEPFVVKDILEKFTVDIIGSCAFGLECNTLEGDVNEFSMYGKKTLKPNILNHIASVFLPWSLIGFLGIKITKSDVTEFFTNLVKNTIKYRETNDVTRKDFMQLLLQLKNENDKQDGSGSRLTEDDIIAQCFIFFLAGFETSSTTMTFAMLELAQHQDIQDKLREEITKVLAKHGGEISYEAVMEMQYLEQVINETLRKFPPVPFLPRTCTKNYVVPGTTLVIKKGTRVTIPVWGLHMDPEFYPNPEVFDPARFTDENKKSRPSFTFLPFGDGPRMCIAWRFGMLQTKVGLIALLTNFKFTLSKKTQLPVVTDPGSFILQVKGQVWVEAEKV